MLPEQSQFAVVNDTILSYKIYRSRKDEDIRLAHQMENSLVRISVTCSTFSLKRVRLLD